MSDIDIIMNLIDWRSSKENQEKGIEMAKDIQCIKAFFQPSGPGYCKSVWENCAVIVCVRSDAELKPYITDMFMWLEDLNWPGAERILQRLLSFEEVNTLARTVELAVPALIAVDETSWLMSIACLLDNQRLRQMLNDTTVSMLYAYLEACT